MKKFKIDREFKEQIITGSLSILLFISGVFIAFFFCFLIFG